MEVKIAVQNVARELEVDVEQTADEVTASIEKAIAEGGLLTLRDAKGRAVLVPGRAIGWVQFGEPEKGRVGFGG